MRLLRIVCPLLLIFGVALFAQEEKKKKGPSPFDNPQNLKILTTKGAELRETMQAFNAALGVMCTECHVQGNFPSDENPKKETARMMITMAREINGKFPDGKQHVRCYTCHRGSTEPATEPPPKAN